MRVLIIAVGSRGDVAPYTGLGVRLQAEGHHVTLATHLLFEDLVRGRGLGFHALPLDTREEMASRLAEAGGGPRSTGKGEAGSAGRVGAGSAGKGRAATDGGDGTGSAGRGGAGVAGGAGGQLRMTLAVNRIVAGHARAMAEAMLVAARQADVLLLSPAGWIGGHVAEGLGLPSMGVYLQPMTPTREFPPATVMTRSLGGWGNRRAAAALLAAGQRPFRAAVGELRDGLGLPPVGPGAWLAGLEAARWPICYGYSTAVVPQPADWPAWHRTVGYWWPAPDPEFVPSPELADFLVSGPAPVYIGFGSMYAVDPEALSALVVAAVRRSGVRAVVNSGWAGLSVAGDDLLTVPDVPHDWLFPRMAAVVHHAGAGTAAAGLRAGVPAVPVPFIVDQPFWARRLDRLGVGPGAIGFRRLSSDRLAAALTEAVGNPRYRERASAVAGQLAREDGAAGVLAVLAQIARG